MGAAYSITSRPDGTVLTGLIYDADHQNHIDNAVPSLFDDYSASVAQMRSIVDPGEVGTEVLATSMAGELERLRHQIKELKEFVNGGTAIAQWYASLTASLNQIDANNFTLRLPGGLLLQSGYQFITGTPNTIGQQTTGTFNFITPFSSKILALWGNTLPDALGSNGGEGCEHTMSISSNVLTGYTVMFMRVFGTSGASEVLGFRWFALGQ